MVITESELRELWRDGHNALPAFPPGTRFSPAAQDFLKDHRLEINYAETTPAAVPAARLPVANSQLPFALDTLAALIGLIAVEARRYQLPALAQRLDALSGYGRELQDAARHGRAPAPSGLPAGNGAGFAPGPSEHAMLHWLNFLRASARQAAAQAAAEGQPALAAALEQVSATAAGLGAQVLSGELGWKPPMV